MEKKNETMMTSSTVICPKCGAEITVTNNQERKHKKMTADEKIEALRKAGIKVDNLFSVNKGGVDGVLICENGGLRLLQDDDPILKNIMDDGTVPNGKLFRRWVMSQMFHMLTYRSYGGAGFTEALRRKGYFYQWRMVSEELKTQVKLFRNDPENFKARNRWFNANTVGKMADEYIFLLTNHILGLPIKRCKGVPYKRINTHLNVFVSDTYHKVIRPLEDISMRIKASCTPDQLHNNTAWFIRVMRRTWCHDSLKMSRIFMDAYKGCGAYYTMQNMILFHGSLFEEATSKEESLKLLEINAENYTSEGYKLLGMLKQLIKDNNIDIHRKMAEWRK
ncbi:MAG: ubiquitin carboxyl-hydrolase [Muribaculaceae bacterium]|nr:ubiquitin carboxyl-hydrolase [Muribaculaceae bacterium]